MPEGFALSWSEVDAIATDIPGATEALTADLAGLAYVPLAVRSSAVGEDSRVASFAGQHQTLLNVVGDDAVLAAIRRVWQSGRDEAALAYRLRMDVADEPANRRHRPTSGRGRGRRCALHLRPGQWQC